jgi:hypothetical protein
MVREVLGALVCVLWGLRAYISFRYRLRYHATGEGRRVWRRGTPEWLPLAMPWLIFLSWAALLAFAACWVACPVPALAGLALLGLSPAGADPCR